MRLPDWSDRTAVCIATGPSLTREQVEAVHKHADRTVRVLAINDAGLPDREPFSVAACDIWYAPDHRFWWHYKDRLQRRDSSIRVGAQAHTERHGLVHATISGAHGGHAGIQALKLALDLGASTVLLLGYDCRKRGDSTNYFGRKPTALEYSRPEPYSAWVPRYRNLIVPPGCRVLNCTPGSAIDAFPLVDIGSFFAERAAA